MRKPSGPWATEPKSRDFLTEQTLAEVQASEAAYVRSIGKLSAIAGQTLENSPSPLAAAYREKLRVLDAEILDLRANVENDLYSSYLRNQLAVLYRDKQRTLEDWTKYATTN